MSRIVGVLHKNGISESENIIHYMGEVFHNANSAKVVSHKNVILGVFGAEKSSVEQYCFEDEDGALILDGKIFNLENCKTESPRYPRKNAPEWLYRSYKESGLKGLAECDGSFTCVILDKKNGNLILSKDRLGFVPLFVYNVGNILVFASEIKAILRHPSVSPRPNLKAIGRYCFYHYRLAFEGNMTFFENINFFPPAKTMIQPLRGGAPRLVNSWSFRCDEIHCSEDEAVNHLKQLTESALKNRMDSITEKCGFFLSGGVDSPAVAALAISRGRNVAAYSSVYKENSQQLLVGDERKNIDKVLLAYPTIKWNPVIPRGNELVDYLESMMMRFDQPIPTITAFPFYKICETASRHGIKTMFTGDGPDHLFAGLYDHFIYFFADLKSNLRKIDYERETMLWYKMHSTPAFPKNEKILSDYLSRCVDLTELGKISGYSWYQPEFANAYLSAVNPSFKFSRIEDLEIAPSPTKSYLKNSLYQYVYHTGSHCASWFEDIVLNTFNVEARSVFFAKEIHEFAWNLPGEFMIKNGLFKSVFRKMLDGKLPDSILYNPVKTGFNAPSNLWLSTILRNKFEALIHSRDSPLAEIYNLEVLDKIYSEHLAGKKNHMMFLWNALSTAIWLEKYFTGKGL